MPSDPCSSVADGDVVSESLPLPLVYYPQQYGTFLAFGQTARSAPLMCTCARSAVDNLFRLRPSLRTDHGMSNSPWVYFPDVIARRIAARNGRSPLPISFSPGLCHQCRNVAPTLRYCDESQGTSFMQAYGWYVNQAFLRLGILPQRNIYLSEVCPPGYQAEIEAAKRLEQEFSAECGRLLELAQTSKRPGASARGASIYFGLPRDEVRQLIELRRRASLARRDLKSKIEDIVTREIGASARSFVSASAPAPSYPTVNHH